MCNTLKPQISAANFRISKFPIFVPVLHGSSSFGDKHLVTVHLVTNFWLRKYLVTKISGDKKRRLPKLMVTKQAVTKLNQFFENIK